MRQLTQWRRQGAFSTYQKLSETFMERSTEWRTCSIWHKFHSIMLLSPKFKMVAQISPWIAWNWWFLVKPRKWNVLFHRKISNGKTGLLFQNSTYSRKRFSGTSGKREFPDFSEFLGKWKAPKKTSSWNLRVYRF